MNDKVSICIPVFNAEKTIADTIRSAISQTYENIEIVIIDNCSNDNTVKIIKSFKDDRIRFYQNDTNIGMTGNWNECIKKATGVFIHFLCADDYIDPKCVEKKVIAFSKNADIVLVTSARDIIDEKNQVIIRRQIYKKNVVIDGRKYSKKSLYTGNIFGEPSCIMFRKSVIEKTGYFSDNLCYSTDWELWIRIAMLGKIVYLCDTLTKYRVSLSNITSSISLGRVLRDDRNMMNNLLGYDVIKINHVDLLIHRVVLTIRNLIRLAFLRTIKAKGKISK